MVEKYESYFSFTHAQIRQHTQWNESVSGTSCMEGIHRILVKKCGYSSASAELLDAHLALRRHYHNSSAAELLGCEQKRQFNILLSKGLEPKPAKILKRRFGMSLTRGRKLYLICKALGFPTLKEILPFINSLQSYLTFTEMTGPVFNLVLSMLNEQNTE
ncbi:hypothetical protein BC833DRAFT_640452 [Globomyces pollinis-pini]|nr:hypothetical protein BC833DRAFT_640452 [Globomyces pollinis-pini]